jgi:hypothetical protein
VHQAGVVQTALTRLEDARHCEFLASLGCRTRKSRILAERVFFWLVHCLVTRQNY